MWEKFKRFLFQNLVVGFLSLIPFIATIYIFFMVLNFTDTFLFDLLPQQIRPISLIGHNIPGLGMFISVVIIILVGLLTRNFLGKRLINIPERIIRKIPILRSLYAAIRQFLEGVFMNRNDAFRKVILIEYPRKGLHTLAFVTNTYSNKDKPKEDVYSIFVPTTPNPTSGFFLIVPVSDTKDLEITVQEAFRLIVSGGVIGGTGKKNILRRIAGVIK